MKKYETLKILDIGKVSYIGMDCIQGELLISMVQEIEKMPKEIFFSWCRSLSNDIHSYHKAREKTYKRITPFSIVVDLEGHLHLLDLQAQGNQEVLCFINNDMMKQKFALPYRCKQNNKFRADYYSYAQTIQFILSQVQFEPKFSKKEVRRLKRIITSCKKDKKRKNYYSMKEVEREIMKITSYKSNLIKLTSGLLCCMLVMKIVMY